MISTTKFNNEDYSIIKDWWADSGCPVPHLTQLQTPGWIGYHNETPVCAVFADRSDSVPVAFLEHIITNPEVKSPMRKLKVVTAMMDRVIGELDNNGYQIIRGTTWSKTLAKICKKRWGFQIIDDKSVNMSLLLS